MNFKAAFAIFGVFLGCCLDAIFLEFAAKIDPGCGTLVTFLQFFSISLYGFIFTVKFFTIPPAIPFRDYLLLVLMFFISSWLNNFALNFNISVPLLMIFRSGSLMANMVLGIYVLNKSYDVWKYFSVAMITFGIFVCTIATGSEVKNSKNGGDENFFYWIMGVGMLAASLFISARMGLYQEVLYKKRGKHATEALFYTHFLALPVFLLMEKNIFGHFKVAMHSKSVAIPIFNTSVPIQLLYMVGNALTHYLCVRCVYTLTAETSSLTVTLVVTLRKFFSLIYSILYFRHPFTRFHWLGTFMIIIGTVIFTEIVGKIRAKISTRVGCETRPLLNEEVMDEIEIFKQQFEELKNQIAKKEEEKSVKEETNDENKEIEK